MQSVRIFDPDIRCMSCLRLDVGFGVIISSLKSKIMGKINRIPGSRLLIPSLPGSALRMHVDSLDKPRDVNKRSQSLAW